MCVCVLDGSNSLVYVFTTARLGPFYCLCESSADDSSLCVCACACALASATGNEEKVPTAAEEEGTPVALLSLRKTSQSSTKINVVPTGSVVLESLHSEAEARAAVPV